MKDLIHGLSKWPLLLGAVFAFTLAIYEETVTDSSEVLIGVAGTVVGSVLLGTWLALFIIDFERRWAKKGSMDSGEAEYPLQQDTERECDG
jgi:hypothetical protein